MFWKTVKPFLTDKGTTSRKITLIESGEILTEDVKVAETLNCFFSDAPKRLNITVNQYLLNSTHGLNDPVDIALKKFDSHPSILQIRKYVSNTTFSFNAVYQADVETVIKNFNPKKVGVHNDIPVKNFKQNYDICTPILLRIISDAILQSTFPYKLKLADIAPLSKNDDVTNKANYRPISMLPIVSKVFEKLIQNQIGGFIESKLFPFMCGYRKGFSTQYALIELIEKLKKSLDIRGYSGVVLMDLSKAFDTLNHALMIAKLHAYGFERSSLNLIHSYLTHRWHRTKINTSFSTWKQLLTGVPQGSILGPLLFNIYINDLFYILNDTESCNYADDTCIYACDKDLNELLIRLTHDSSLAIDWFEYNYMKLNSDKCHLLFAGHKYEHLWIDIDGNKIWESTAETLLGINVDRNLYFDNHVNTICRRASKKLTALARLSNILPFYQMKILISSFFNSQFSYCPLIWMFCSRMSNNKINKLQERSLRILYKDDYSNFEELLKKNHSVTIHIRNIQLLAIEMYKLKNNLSLDIMTCLFPRNEYSYNMRNCHDFMRPNPKTVRWGTESLTNLGPIIWDIVPTDIKSLPTLHSFKQRIKRWDPQNCPCRLCKVYVRDLGFL